MTYEEWLLCLCVWREARGETLDSKLVVLWSIRNRIAQPGWWGTDTVSVILCKEQYSSFNLGDPNSTKFPKSTDPAWLEAVGCLTSPKTDPTGGATHYYDRSRDGNPPAWAAKMTHIKNVGNFRLFR